MKRFKYLHNLNLIGYLITIAFVAFFFIEIFINKAYVSNTESYFVFLFGSTIIFLAVFQVLSALVLLSQWRKLNNNSKKLLLIYFIIVFIYWVAYFLILAFASIFIYYMILLALGIATYFVAVTYMAKEMNT